MFRIAIIGCGNMGLTYVRSFLQFNLVTPENLLLIAKNEAHKEQLDKLESGKTHIGIGYGGHRFYSQQQYQYSPN